MKIFRGPAYNEPIGQSFINGFMDGAAIFCFVLIAVVLFVH